jgi:VTC domain.
VIVDYVREAFVMPYQDIRITFDKELAVGLNKTGLFDRGLPTMLVLEPGLSILEVKFNDHLPAYYHDLLQGIAVERSALSKYLICRSWVSW